MHRQRAGIGRAASTRLIVFSRHSDGCLIMYGGCINVLRLVQLAYYGGRMFIIRVPYSWDLPLTLQSRLQKGNDLLLRAYSATKRPKTCLCNKEPRTNLEREWHEYLHQVRNRPESEAARAKRLTRWVSHGNGSRDLLNPVICRAVLCSYDPPGSDRGSEPPALRVPIGSRTMSSELASA